MFYWDRRYLEEVAKAGIEMHLYERYVDDSQQVAEIENGEEHETVRRLHDIANNIVEDIVMTVDLPENFEDKKLPILDMKVWLGEEDGRIYYQHFEKPTSSKLVISSRSAHSGTCKRSVHIKELATKRIIGKTSCRMRYQYSTSNSRNRTKASHR